MVSLSNNGDIWVRRAKPVQTIGRKCLQVGSTETYGGPQWEILTPAGPLKSRVTLPEGFAPRRFCGGWLFGILTDELGIETVARVAVGLEDSTTHPDSLD